jgi:hypothetical protein
MVRPSLAPAPSTASSNINRTVRMSEIHQVYATVRLPRDDDPGRVAVGYFTLVDDVLT